MRLPESSAVPRYFPSSAGERTRVGRARQDIEDCFKCLAQVAVSKAPCGRVRHSPGLYRFRRRKYSTSLPNRLGRRCCTINACFGSVSGCIRYLCPDTGTESDITPSSSFAKSSPAGHPYTNEPAQGSSCGSRARQHNAARERRRGIGQCCAVAPMATRLRTHTLLDANCLDVGERAIRNAAVSPSSCGNGFSTG